MLTVIAYILNLFAPIVQPLGLLGAIACVLYDELQPLYLAAGLALVGFILGLFLHRLDIPPRWFWAKSQNQRFQFSLARVLGYMWSLAAWPLAVYFVRLILSMVTEDMP